MPPEMSPKGPKPPEFGTQSKRALRIAMIGFLWNIIKQSEERRKNQKILLRVANPNKRLESVDDVKRAFCPERIMLKNLRAGLDRDLEAEGEKTNTLSESELIADLLDTAKLPLPIRKALGDSLRLLINFAKEVGSELESKGVIATLEPIKHSLTDQTFIDRFDYNGVIRGLDDEVVALLPRSSDMSRLPLYLGMTISYTKRLEPSGQTGPLTGRGKIVAFLFPSREGDIIHDQVIKLEVQTDDGPVETLLSLDEMA